MSRVVDYLKTYPSKTKFLAKTVIYCALFYSLCGLVFLDGEYADNARSVLRFMSWLMFFVTLWIVFDVETRDKCKKSIAENQGKPKFWFHKVYQHIRILIEPGVLVFIGLPFTALAYMFVFLFNYGLKQQVSGEIIDIMKGMKDEQETGSDTTENRQEENVQEENSGAAS
jgi:hypothetical protein